MEYLLKFSKLQLQLVLLSAEININLKGGFAKYGKNTKYRMYGTVMSCYQKYTLARLLQPRRLRMQR